MSQPWSFEPYLSEILYAYTYFGVPHPTEIRQTRSWSIKIGKVELDTSAMLAWQPSTRCITLESWVKYGKVFNPITIACCTLDDVVRWQLDCG